MVFHHAIDLDLKQDKRIKINSWRKTGKEAHGWNNWKINVFKCLNHKVLTSFDLVAFQVESPRSLIAEKETDPEPQLSSLSKDFSQCASFYLGFQPGQRTRRRRTILIAPPRPAGPSECSRPSSVNLPCSTRERAGPARYLDAFTRASHKPRLVRLPVSIFL